MSDEQFQIEIKVVTVNIHAIWRLGNLIGCISMRPGSLVRLNPNLLQRIK